MIGADDGIVPTLMNNIPMRDYSEINRIWREVVNILRSKMFDRDLQIKGPMSTTGPLANMSRFCRNSSTVPARTQNKLYNNLKQSKLKIEGFGIDLNSREVVAVVVSFVRDIWVIGPQNTPTRFLSSTTVTRHPRILVSAFSMRT